MRRTVAVVVFFGACGVVEEVTDVAGVVGEFVLAGVELAAKHKTSDKVLKKCQQKKIT